VATNPDLEGLKLPETASSIQKGVPLKSVLDKPAVRQQFIL
jgi:hypothetical protein